MAKHYRTAYGAYKARQARRASLNAGRFNFASGVTSGAAGVAFASGAGVPVSAGLFAGAVVLGFAQGRYKRQASRARAMGAYVERLAMGRAASQRSRSIVKLSTVQRAARSLNRSVARSGGSGQVKGYYRQGPSGQVFVREYQRAPASR